MDRVNKLVFSLRDHKAEIFLQPFMFNTKGEAIRTLMETVKDTDPNNMIAKYPADFSLYYIADFDMLTGLYSVKTPLELVGCASDFVPVINKPEVVKS